MKVILAINAGSSSVKISVYLADHNAAPRQIADAQVSGLTAPPAQLTYTRGDTTVCKNKAVDGDGDNEKVSSQDGAFALLLRTLVDDAQLPELPSPDAVAIACHRIVHGGDYADAKVITPDTYHHLEELSDLAPLHNGAALAIVDACMRQLPRARNVACFDSQFHASLPRHVATYPIDPAVARKNRLRKYGFHGISYAFVARSVAGFLAKDQGDLNVIALHLGSGASACAIRGGKSWDTSMGLTPLAGLPGATRSGSVDPSLVFHYASDVGKLSPASTSHLHISKAEEILNKQSGWKALTGTTDFAAIAASYDPSAAPAPAAASDGAGADDPDPDNHRLAFDIFVDRICGFVGAYYVSLEGRVDALVFAGGIGEKSAALRAAVVRRAACLGFALDDARNGSDVTGVVQDVGRDGARHRVLVCQTDEQYEMARLCADRDELWT